MTLAVRYTRWQGQGAQSSNAMTRRQVHWYLRSQSDTSHSHSRISCATLAVMGQRGPGQRRAAQHALTVQRRSISQRAAQQPQGASAAQPILVLVAGERC